MDTPRTVVGTIRHPSGQPWAGGEVVFELLGGSFTPSVQYPSSRLVVVIGADGIFSADLWPNEEGDAASSYRCRLPSGDTFTFTLPAGDGSDIEISLLRELGVTADEAQYATLLTYVDEHAIAPAQAATAAATAAASAATTAAATADAASATATSSAAGADAATVSALEAAADAVAATVRAEAAATSHGALIRAGRATVATNVAPPGLRIAADQTLREVHAIVGTAPTGAALIVAIVRSGVTLTTVQILAGATAGSTTGLAVALAAGDVLTFNITQIGSTIPGSDLAVFLEGEL